MVSIFFFNFFLVVVFNINNLTSLGSWLMSGAIVSIGGYALVRIRFSNFRFMLAQVLHIAVMGLWAMLPYALVVFVYQRFILSAFVWTLPLFFLWLVVFLQIYNKFGNYLIEKIVNHGRDWLHAKDELMASIAKELDYRDIIFAVLDFFTSLIKNKGSLIVAELFDGEELYVEGALDYKTDIDKFWLMYRNLYTSGVVKSLVREEIESSRDPNLKRMASLMRQNGFEVCFPLVMYKEIKGVVVMGAKLTLDPYYVQDVDLVEQTLAELAPVLNKAVIYQDVTDYNKNLQAKIDKATKRLSATNNKLMLADKLKDEFVSVASHELRTPMTAIKGYLWLVHTKYKANKAELNQRYIKIALDATERLIGLVNDMLTISRIEGNRFELNSQEFDLRELVQQIHQELLPIARSKKLDFVVDMPKKPLMVMADSRKISEVLHNLIGNALKFTIKGSVTLKCFAEGNTVLCSVIDTGVGIAKDDADKLFKKFARLEKSYVKIKETGTGLGLYISQQIMKKHSGGINYESEVGVGSVFTIDLPKLREAERAG
jgi:signal transduction histidine kinase